MPLRSAIAAFHSLALTLARTAERSGASLVVGVSTAFTAEARPTSTQTPRRAIPKARVSVEVLMIVSLVCAFPNRHRGRRHWDDAPVPPRHPLTELKAYPPPPLLNAPAP